MRHRVLIIAEAANPQWVSVPLVGWSHARAIMDVTDAHLVTQVRNRNAIAATGLVEGEDFTAIDSEAIARRGHQFQKMLRGKSGGNWTTSRAIETLTYPWFETLIWRKFGQRIQAGEFDVVHRLTPLSPAIPSLLARKCRKAGVPFVFGPINGGVPWPKDFERERRRENEWLSPLRELYRLWPGYHSTRRNAAAIMCASRITWSQMPRSYRHKCFYVPENSIDPARFQKRRCHKASLPIRGVFIGRLVPLKGVDMLLDAALQYLRDGKMTLDIVGDGPEMPRIKGIVEREKLENAVTLAGWVKHEQVQDRLAGADVMILPSIREFGGGAALEAMAVGAVPVVLNYGGLGELVSAKTGFLIEMGTRAQIIGRLRDVLGELVARPELIDEKSQAAYRRAHEQFTWAAKVKQTVAIYDWVLGPKRATSVPNADARSYVTRVRGVCVLMGSLPARR